MKLLALETTAKAASCAVLEDGMPLATAWQATGLTHSRTLLPMVEDMLKNSELKLQDMDIVAVAAGPGSFTGLRIGIAGVKGLAWAADKPCIPVSTLEAMAWPLSHLDGIIVADCRSFDAPITVVGDGAVLCHSYFTTQGIDCTLAPPHLRLQSAVGVGMAAANIGMSGAVSAQDLAPIYLRLSQAERERLARLNAEAK